MISSRNGIDWSAPKMIFNSSFAYLSPDILYVDGAYKVWSAGYDGKMYFLQSNDLKTWTAAQEVNLQIPDYKIWHQDMIKTPSGYETVFCAYKGGQFNSQMYLFYARSSDGLNFSSPELILGPSQNPGAYDNALIYRSSLVDIDGVYKVYYSAMNKSHHWHVFLTDLIQQ